MGNRILLIYSDSLESVFKDFPDFVATYQLVFSNIHRTSFFHSFNNFVNSENWNFDS